LIEDKKLSLPVCSLSTLRSLTILNAYKQNIQRLLSLFKRRRKIIYRQTTLNGYLRINHDIEEPYKDNEYSEFKGFESSAVMDMEDLEAQE